MDRLEVLVGTLGEQGVQVASGPLAIQGKLFHGLPEESLFRQLVQLAGVIVDVQDLPALGLVDYDRVVRHLE